MAPPPQATTAPPGRPRSAATHQAILDAALEMFIAAGLEAMTIEGIAARAGVAKTTIYRRWSAKEDLLVEAVESQLVDVHAPDTGALRSDLVALIVLVHRLMVSAPIGEAFPRMAAEVATGSPLGRAYLTRVISPRVAIVESILDAAKRRGELRAGLDPATVNDMLMGPIILARLGGRLPARGAARRAERIVDVVLEGIRAGS